MPDVESAEETLSITRRFVVNLNANAFVSLAELGVWKLWRHAELLDSIFVGNAHPFSEHLELGPAAVLHMPRSHEIPSAHAVRSPILRGLHLRFAEV